MERLLKINIMGRPKTTSASDIRRPDPFPLPVSQSTKMVPDIKLQAPPTDIRASAFSHPLPSTPWLTSFLDGPLRKIFHYMFKEMVCIKIDSQKNFKSRHDLNLLNDQNLKLFQFP